MQSHVVTTHANILQQLKEQLPATTNIISAPLPSVVDENEMQTKLNHIANKPTNFGYGCGVALEKGINNAKLFCNKLARELSYAAPGFLDYLFREGKGLAIIQSWERTWHDSSINTACKQHVQALEEIAKGCESNTPPMSKIAS